MTENSTDWLLPESLEESKDGLRTAIRFGGESISYHELLHQTNQAAHFWVAQGLRQRDCVALVLRDSPVFFAAFLGAMKIGAVPALVSTFVGPLELENILKICSARFVLTEPDFFECLLQIRNRVESLEQMFICETPGEESDTLRSGEVVRFACQSDSTDSPPGLAPTVAVDPAFFLFTSGSTGHPKAVVHVHADIRHTVENYGRPVLKLLPEDRVFSSPRLFFAYGLGNSLSFPIAARATTILCREKPTPEVIARVFREESPTVFFSVPAVYRALLEYHRNTEKLDLKSMRFCVSAGEALPAIIFEEWKETFAVEILDGIGTTEALHMFLSNRQGKARPGSSGTVVDGYEICIVGESGESLAADQPGHLMVRGNTFGQYYDPTEGFGGGPVTEWARTGDLYRRDAEGYFYFCGRSADHFKVQGLWVAPMEIEEALLAHEAVLEAGVVPMSDENGLLRPRAHVVLREKKTASAEELKEFLSRRLHSYQLPQEIVFMDKLPRTATGKLQRYKLRKLE